MTLVGLLAVALVVVSVVYVLAAALSFRWLGNRETYDPFDTPFGSC